LLSQSGLRPEDFAGKRVLEVGCGAGRFTEVLLSFGAHVIALDYSAAVDACAASNDAARADGRLVVGQADVFKLPVLGTFDIVVGYGMLQHTGDPRRALQCLWDRVRPGGLLLVDRYQVGARRLMLFKYAVRPLSRRLPPQVVLAASEKAVRTLFPLQRAAIRQLQGGGVLRKLARFAVNRAPTAVYPINLEVAGKLDKETALRWSILDTFDQYAPAYDLPCTNSQWRRDLSALGGDLVSAGSGGQGNVGVVRRGSSPSASHTPR
jgi:SAM-dependent methyltransferase